jgi:hypothetical protein
MTTPSLRRPRVSVRAFGFLLALFFSAGQAALIAHHHPSHPGSSGKVILSADGGSAADADCRLCDLSAQARVSHAAASAPCVAAALIAETVLVVAPSASAQTACVRLSSRGPPAV